MDSITFQSDVSFTPGQILNSEEIPDLVRQEVTGDVKIITLMPGLRKANPWIHRGRYRYKARPWPSPHKGKDPVIQ